MKRLKTYLLLALIACFSFSGSQAQINYNNDTAPKNKINGNFDKIKQSYNSTGRKPNANKTSVSSKSMFDLIFEYPCAIGGGEAGIESDGEYIYTTKWNGDQFYKYSIEGTFIDSLTIPGVSNIRDLAYDGTYFFGGAASTTVYELDFENSVLVGSFTAPTDVRAIAYDEYEDVFYANNWSSDITVFDFTGVYIYSFPVGYSGASYYGFAYDGYSAGPYLWGYSQTGATQNELIQIHLPDGTETGLVFDVGSVAATGNGIAGGLCIDQICYDIAFIGVSQNVTIWALELGQLGCVPENDLTVNSIIEPASGVPLTNSEQVSILIKNIGTNPQSDFIVSFTYNGSEPYYDTVFTTINFNETYTFTFDTTINMTSGSTHIIEACTHLPGDQCSLNDCKQKTLFTSQFGSLEGYLTNCISGDPIEGGTVEIAGNTVTTGNDGHFFIESVPAGIWELTYNASGYCPPFDPVMVTIEEGIATSVDVCLSPAELEVEPTSINVTLDPNATTTETIILYNPGTCNIDWSADLVISPPAIADEFLDAQFQYPLNGSTGQSGIECDGEYFYISGTNGQISRYALDGTFIETLSISFFGSDLAFNGTYFYGGNGSSTVYEMDFYTQTIISSFNVAENVRAIAYNQDLDIFYGYSWGGNIIAFDPSGALIATAPVGPSGANYSGFAYDNSNADGPYLWGYGLVGTDPNTLVQIQLPDLVETGLIISLGDLLPEPLSNSAGGLFTQPDIFPGTLTLGGVVTDEWIWGLELSEYYTWVSIGPASGTIAPGETEEMEVNFDAINLLPGIYESEINFTTVPGVNVPVVDITMTIEGMCYPCNLQAELFCTNITLQWEMCPAGCNPADSYNIYQNGELIANVQEMNYTDSLLFPDSTYDYEITAIYGGDESPPAILEEVYVPTPDDLEPFNLDFITSGDEITLFWNSPASCVEPMGFNLYRDNTLINTSLITDTSITVSIGNYSFFVTAVYYFGESNPSNSIIITGTTETNKNIVNVFPNPVKSIINITSPTKIKTMKLLSNTGQVILEKEINSLHYRLDISLYERGIYFIKLDSEQATLIKKIVIE